MNSPIKRFVLIKNANLDVGWLEFIFVNLMYQLGITRFDPRRNRLTEFEYRVSVDLVQPGDIVLLGQYRRLSSLIIGGVFTHAVVYAGSGECVHVDGQGVRTVTYRWLFDEFDTLAIVRVPSISTEQREGIVHFMQAHIGEPFDYWFDEKDTRAWFCSELICAALRSVGVDKTICNVNKNLPHPSDFAFAGMDVIYTSHCLEERNGKAQLCYPVSGQ